MSDGFSAGLQVTVLVVALVAVHRPLGDWMALAFTSTHHTRGESLVYRLVRVDPDADQRWPVYARSHARDGLAGARVDHGADGVYRDDGADDQPVISHERRGPDAALPGAEHRRVVRDEHELAVVLG